MEAYEEAQEKAKKHLKIADHMLTQSYPIVKDPKLLVTVIENLFLALESSMSALLYYDRLYKRIPPFHDGFDSKLEIFRSRCNRRYNFKNNYPALIREIKEIISEHKKAPMEFSRKGQFVICSDNYSTKSITVEKMKEHIAQAKLFIADMERMVERK